MDALTLYAGGTRAIVGESHYQDTLAKVARIATSVESYLPELKGRARGVATRQPDRRWFRAVLFREPHNPYDSQAVAVHAAGVGLVGYLDRDAAREYAPVFDELERQGYSVGACPAMLTGGGPGKSWGVVLCVSAADTVLSDLRSPTHEV